MAKSWYIALGTQGRPSVSNDDPRLSFDLFTASHKFVSLCIFIGKILKIEFLIMY